MDIKEIRSTQNETYKTIKSLRDKKGRDSLGMFFIEGTRFVEEALCGAQQIEWILFSEKYPIENIYKRLESLMQMEILPKKLMKPEKPAENQIGIMPEIQPEVKGKNIKYLRLPEKLFNEICNTETPQGIAAVLRNLNYDIETITGTKKMFLILDRIQDPGNMGTMIRTADAAGFDAVMMSEGCVDIYNPKVLRATMGSIFHLPVIKSNNVVETIRKMKNNGVKIYAADLKGDHSMFDEKFSSKTAIITGNEGNGISSEVLDEADVLLKIPMAGAAESLNASVAGGILLYEVFRKQIIDSV